MQFTPYLKGDGKRISKGVRELQWEWKRKSEVHISHLSLIYLSLLINSILILLKSDYEGKRGSEG